MAYHMKEKMFTFLFLRLLIRRNENSSNTVDAEVQKSISEVKRGKDTNKHWVGGDQQTAPQINKSEKTMSFKRRRKSKLTAAQKLKARLPLGTQKCTTFLCCVPPDWHISKSSIVRSHYLKPVGRFFVFFLDLRYVDTNYYPSQEISTYRKSKKNDKKWPKSRHCNWLIHSNLWRRYLLPHLFLFRRPCFGVDPYEFHASGLYLGDELHPIFSIIDSNALEHKVINKLMCPKTPIINQSNALISLRLLVWELRSDPVFMKASSLNITLRR